MVGLLVQGCGEKQPEAEVLATVNGEPITGLELEQALQRMFGDNAGRVSGQAEEKALESLVMMRAIAQRQERSMSPEALAELESRVRRYREELLAEAYLRDHAGAYAPTDDEIREYYKAHRERFGGQATRRYEVLRAGESKEAQLPSVLKALADAGEQEDWRTYAAELKQQGLAVAYARGGTDGPALPDRLVQVIGGLSVNEASDVFYVNKKPQVVRVTEQLAGSPQPLDEVRDEIRKALTVRHMKNEIGAVSEQVLNDADVKYHSRNGDETKQ